MRVRKGGGHIQVEFGGARDSDNRGGGRVGSEKKELWKLERRERRFKQPGFAWKIHFRFS